MNEAEIIARRLRAHLIADIERVASADDEAALHDTELGQELGLFAEGGHASLSALTTQEAEAARRLADEIVRLWDRALADRRRGWAFWRRPRIEPADLASLGWFERVRPLAQSALTIFMVRGTLDQGLWQCDPVDRTEEADGARWPSNRVGELMVAFLSAAYGKLTPNLMKYTANIERDVLSARIIVLDEIDADELDTIYEILGDTVGHIGGSADFELIRAGSILEASRASELPIRLYRSYSLDALV